MSKKSKYHVFEGDNLDYIIKVKETDKKIHYKMYRSDASHWNIYARGEWVEYWVDHGNGFEGLDIDDRQTDYDRLHRVAIMCDFVSKYDKNLFTKYKIKKA